MMDRAPGGANPGLGSESVCSSTFLITSLALQILVVPAMALMGGEVLDFSMSLCLLFQILIP